MLQALVLGGLHQLLELVVLAVVQRLDAGALEARRLLLLLLLEALQVGLARLRQPGHDVDVVAVAVLHVAGVHHDGPQEGLPPVLLLHVRLRRPPRDFALQRRELARRALAHTPHDAVATAGRRAVRGALDVVAAGEEGGAGDGAHHRGGANRGVPQRGAVLAGGGGDGRHVGGVSLGQHAGCFGDDAA